MHLLSAVFIILVPLLSIANSPPTFNVEATLKQMTEDQKVGQLFMFGFKGDRVDPQLRALLTKLKPGSLIIFGRNVKTPRQIADLNSELQAISMRSTAVPYLLAVDQEGGNVVRIRTMPSLPSALSLASTEDPNLLYEAGLESGRLLKTLGINMNLAPVLDVANYNTDAFIGTRTLGASAGEVAKLGLAFGKGLMAAGVLPTGKHFPGHGGVLGDSHQETIVNTQPRDVLEKTALAPFSLVAKEKSPWALMVAHVGYSSLDESNTPATFSKPILTKILREQIKFSGLVLTDDLEMAGASAIRRFDERVLRSFEAGADIMMIAWNRRLQAQAVTAVREALRSGRISSERLNASVRRILQAKQSYAFLPGGYRKKDSDIRNVLASKKMRDLSDQVLASRVEKLATETTWLPDPKDRSITVISASYRFFDMFRRGAAGFSVKFAPLRESSGSLAPVFARGSNFIFYVSGPISARLTRLIPEKMSDKVLIVNSEAPSLLDRPERFPHQANLFFRHPNAGTAVSRALFQNTPVSLRQPSTANPNVLPETSRSKN